MKRLTQLFLGLLSLTFLGEPVLAQQNQVFCRVRDGQTSTSWADVHQLTITFPTTDLGLQTKAGNYYYDTTGSLWRYWEGIQSATNLTALPRAPFTLGLPYFYSISSTDLELLRGDPLDGDDVAGTTEAPYFGAFNHGWDATNSLWKRFRLDSDGEAIIAGYTAATDSNRVEEIDPLSQHYAAETIADETDYTESGPPDTLYYYVDMAGYQESGFQFELGCDAGTVTVTVECSLMDDGTAPALCTYQDVTNDVFGIIQLQAAATTASDMWIDDAGALGICKYVRVKVVSNTGDDSGDWAIYMKKMY